MALRKITKRVDVPNEPGEWFDLRMLGWKQLDEAKSIRSAKSFQDMKAMGSDTLKAIREAQASGESATKLAAAVADPLNEYDLGTLLTKGIAAWSYDDPLTPDSIGDLDPETAKWAAKIIIGIETAVERKNELNGSISPYVAEGQPQTGG